MKSNVAGWLPLVINLGCPLFPVSLSLLCNFVTISTTEKILYVSFDTKKLFLRNLILIKGTKMQVGQYYNPAAKTTVIFLIGI